MSFVNSLYDPWSILVKSQFPKNFSTNDDISVLFCHLENCTRFFSLLVRLQLHGAINRTDSVVLMLRFVRI